MLQLSSIEWTFDRYRKSQNIKVVIYRKNRVLYVEHYNTKQV